MRITRLAVAALLFSAAPVLADDIDGARAGEIQGQIELKQEGIKKEYDGRKLSSEERKERDQRLKDAANDVLEKNGTNDKDFSRATKHLSRDEHEAMDQSRKATKSKAKEAHPTAAEPAPDAKKGSVEQVDGIVVEKGTDAAKAEGAADGANGDGSGDENQGPPPSSHSRHKHH